MFSINNRETDPNKTLNRIVVLLLDIFSKRARVSQLYHSCCISAMNICNLNNIEILLEILTSFYNYRISSKLHQGNILLDNFLSTM